LGRGSRPVIGIQPGVGLHAEDELLPVPARRPAARRLRRGAAGDVPANLNAACEWGRYPVSPGGDHANSRPGVAEGAIQPIAPVASARR